MNADIQICDAPARNKMPKKALYNICWREAHAVTVFDKFATYIMLHAASDKCLSQGGVRKSCRSLIETMQVIQALGYWCRAVELDGQM